MKLPLLAVLLLASCTNVYVIEQATDAGSDAAPRAPSCDDLLPAAPPCEYGGQPSYAGRYQCIAPVGYAGKDFAAPCLRWINGVQYAVISDCHQCGPDGGSGYPP